ncbi:MAG: DUF4358 domain-containing protein [Clostridiales bacterium]|jgi:hypothetical protein|nr:DUF4358 domain-containing protein [Clostridiales bacterium]
MIKRISVCVLLALVLTGCGKKSAGPIDLQAFSSDILASGAFLEQLTEVEPDIGYSFYQIADSDCKQAFFFFSSGATAEELALFEASDAQAAARIRAAAEKRIENQKKAFESYVPAEVPKLEQAVVYTRGNYVIVFTASDYNAAKTVQDKHKL